MNNRQAQVAADGNPYGSPEWGDGSSGSQAPEGNGGKSGEEGFFGAFRIQRCPASVMGLNADQDEPPSSQERLAVR